MADLSVEHFRGLPVTAVRMIRAVKFNFSEDKIVPSSNKLEEWQISALQAMYKRPLNKKKGKKKSKVPPADGDVKNFINQIEGAVVNKLRPWMFSSAFTFAYFVFHKYVHFIFFQNIL